MQTLSMMRLLPIFFIASARAGSYQGVRHIFIRRNRKAGSSTLAKFVHDFVKVAEAMRPGPPRLEYGMDEFKCMPWNCKLQSSTFLVTNLRDPMTRLVSEYWWRSQSPGQTYNASTAAIWRRWIDEGSIGAPLRKSSVPTRPRAGSPISKYQSDPYVKAFAGSCRGGTFGVAAGVPRRR